MTPTTISDAEAQVMHVLWAAQGPMAADAVATALAAGTDWQLSTVKTLLGRLCAKGAVATTQDGRRFLYTPVLARGDWQREQSVSLLDRLFEGRLAPLVAQFASGAKLAPEDRAALEKLLKEQDDA